MAYDVNRVTGRSSPLTIPGMIFQVAQAGFLCCGGIWEDEVCVSTILVGYPEAKKCLN